MNLHLMMRLLNSRSGIRFMLVLSQLVEQDSRAFSKKIEGAWAWIEKAHSTNSTMTLQSAPVKTHVLGKAHGICPCRQSRKPQIIQIGIDIGVSLVLSLPMKYSDLCCVLVVNQQAVRFGCQRASPYWCEWIINAHSDCSATYPAC